MIKNKLIKMADIPCIKNKCIVLPVCKTKHLIRCEELFIDYSNSFNIFGVNEYHNRLVTLFPNLSPAWDDI